MSAHTLDEGLEKQVIWRRTALHKIPGSGGYKTLAIVLVGLVVIMIACLLFVPWQQSIVGVGQVTVFSPMDRPQNIEAQISGRIAAWHVREGETVEKGELLVELAETDPKFLDPNQLNLMRAQRAAYMARKQAAEQRINALQNQQASYQASRGAAVPSAQLKISQAGQRIEAARQALRAANQQVKTASLNFSRVSTLHAEGLRSTRDRELAEQTLIEARAEKERAEAQLQVAMQDETVADFESEKVEADTAASISGLDASIAGAYDSLASVTNDLAKLDVDIQNLVQRISQRQLRAPRNGTVVQIMQAGPGETVSEGDVLATLMPLTADRAVELTVSDNDVPLISEGRPVRLQFAGWPAVQFAGWPSVAVGTFAGRVKVIDAIGGTTSRYRVWVEPDTAAIQNGNDEPWPSSKYLRPGSEAVGWIMLDTVPLWFELWRQFNAFPPTVDQKTPASDQKGTAPKASIPKPKKRP